MNKELEDLAHKIKMNAYSPYSTFKVGCALTTAAGNVYFGCNVENLSYGLTCCAERNAIFNAVAAEGPTMRLDKVVVVAQNSEGVSPGCSPCGACRQVIAEFSTPVTRVYYKRNDDDTQLAEVTVAQLLPDQFNSVFQTRG